MPIIFSKCRHIVGLINLANTLILIKLNPEKMKDEGRKLDEGKYQCCPIGRRHLKTHRLGCADLCSNLLSNVEILLNKTISSLQMFRFDP